MTRKLKPATSTDVYLVEQALTHARNARHFLKGADAPKSLAKVRLAIKSIEGALRHVERRARSGS